MATSPSSDDEPGTLPIEERTTPRRSQRVRGGVANVAPSRSSSDDDEEVVLSTLADKSPRRSPRVRGGVANVAPPRSSRNDDEEVVLSTLVDKSPHRSPRIRGGVANVAAPRSSSDDDEEVVPSTLADKSPHNDDDEVPSSVPPGQPVRSRGTSDLDRYEDDCNQSDSDDDDEEYATAEAVLSDEDDIPISSIRGANKPRQKAASKQNQKKSTTSVSKNASCCF